MLNETTFLALQIKNHLNAFVVALDTAINNAGGNAYAIDSQIVLDMLDEWEGKVARSHTIQNVAKRFCNASKITNADMQAVCVSYNSLRFAREDLRAIELAVTKRLGF